jgi:hypothetical protein
VSVNVPALVIRVGFEQKPQIYFDCATDHDVVRVCLWIDRHPELYRAIAELFAAVEREVAA